MQRLHATANTQAQPHTITTYNRTSKLLHWGMAGLIFYMLYLGLTMTDLPLGIEKIRLYGLHKSLGICVLSLLMLRVAWRVITMTPKPMTGMSVRLVLAARATHYAMYALMLCMPITGWLMSSAAGFPVAPFGFFTLSALIAPSPSALEFFKETHELLAFLFMGMISLHVIAALYHHFYRKDATLRRMLPFVRRVE